MKKKWYKKWWIYPPILLIALIVITNIVYQGHPVFKSIKSPIYDSPITIEGYGVEANAEVNIILNDEITSINANEKGEFSTSLNLIEGENILDASTVTSKGKTKTSTTKKIVYIIKAPNLEILEPANNSKVENPEITIKGKTDKSRRS